MYTPEKGTYTPAKGTTPRKPSLRKQYKPNGSAPPHRAGSGRESASCLLDPNGHRGITVRCSDDACYSELNTSTDNDQPSNCAPKSQLPVLAFLCGHARTKSLGSARKRQHNPGAAQPKDGVTTKRANVHPIKRYLRTSQRHHT